MTLDDFFTLTEMNNGLAAPDRVRELVAVMQKESDCVVKNIGEATRQWHAVARAIAATENRECLDLFIQLDGLQFIVKWLKDAQKFGNESKDEFVEEAITHMLRALGKLHVDYDKLVDSEMWTTVKDLLAHSSSKVHDKARVLFESWEGKKDGGASLSIVEDLKDGQMGRGSEHSEPSQGDGSLSRETYCNEKGQESTAKDNPMVPASSDAVNPGQVENGNNLDQGIDTAVGGDSPSKHDVSPSLVKPKEVLASHSMGATSVKSGDSDFSRQDTLGVVSASDIKLDPATENSPGKLESVEDSKTTGGRSSPSGSGAADATKSVTELSSLKNSASEHIGIGNQDSASIESKTIDSNGKGSVENNLSASQCGSSSATELGDEQKGHKLSESSSGKRSWESTKGFGAFLSGLADQAKINNLDQEDKSDVNLANDYKFAKRVKKTETARTGKQSDSDILGMVDPLEMALQVAIEVGREVGDYREEQSSSVSEKQVDGNVQMPGSPDSVSGRQSHTSKSSSKDVSSSPELSDEALPMQEESATSSKNQDVEQTNEIQNTATSQVTEVTQEGDNAEKDLCNFDLNEEVYLEEADHPRSEFDTPISIVSASRAASTSIPGLPAAPLQFEGNHGWRGIAATSAFRPASPRRMQESEKDHGLKLRQGGLDIDLNVAESVDGRTEDLIPGSGLPFFSALPPSGEHSAGTNPKSVQLELDLNNTSEDSARPFMRQFFPHGNGYDAPSSSKLPSLKNIDLNDQPSFLKHTSGSSYASQSTSSSVISIMGTRVEVSCKDTSTPQTVSLSNGRTPDLAFDANAGRTANFLGMHPYAHSHTPVYGYNNVPPGPSMMPLSSSPIYGSGGPVPYMIDPRGTPIISQIMGASTSATPMGFSQTPFFMNMTTPTPSNVSVAGSSRSPFDLNSGTMLEGGGSRDPPPGFTQFLNLGPVRPTDDHTRYNSQTPFGPAVGGKRKEPDTMWEHYPAKHFSQWK